MLSKGTELFMFEGEFYKLKQKWINQDMDEEKWTDLFNDMDKLLKRYSNVNVATTYYCLRSQIAFIEFLHCKSKGEYR